MPRGDIDAAYCGDKFPKLKIFVHEGQVYTVTGLHFLTHKTEAECYPLYPVGSIKLRPMRYSYQGEIGTFRGKSWTLGPQVMFVASDPSVPDSQALLRAKYANGGMFAMQPTYGEFLESLRDKKSKNTYLAIKAEQSGSLLSVSKQEMIALLKTSRRPQVSDSQQLNLF